MTGDSGVMVSLGTIGSAITDASPVGMIIGFAWLAYWLVSSGRVIPKSTFDLIVAQYDKILNSKDETIASQEKQIAAQHDINETTKRVLESLEEAGRVNTVGKD